MDRLHLQSLPVELVCYVLSYLDLLDLLRCNLLSKRFRTIIQQSSRLQLRIDLERYCMVPALTRPVSYSHRLAQIRERERAWRQLDWKRQHKLTLPPTGSIYEFVDGYYGNGKEDKSKTTASISFFKLPSAEFKVEDEHGPGASAWSHLMDLTIIDFTMDPSPDLLVLVALAPSE